MVAAPKNPLPALLVVCSGFFLLLLDGTIVNVAIPTMLTSLGASLDQILWVINAYLLALAVLLITAARVGDIVGPRNVFAAGLVVFTVASLLCGLAQDANQLIAARVLQGAGAAMMTAQVLVIASALFPPERRGAALGIVGMANGLAVVSGPVVGGIIVTYFDWRWIFYVNVPICAIALAFTFLVVPDVRTGRPHRVDAIGVILATAGLFAILFGLIEGQRYSWDVIDNSSISIPAACCWSPSLFGSASPRNPWCPWASSASSTTP